MNSPLNPKQHQARAAMMQHNAPLLQNPVKHTETILLTFPGLDAGTVSADEIEAWYAVAMQLHREALAAHDAPGG